MAGVVGPVVSMIGVVSVVVPVVGVVGVVGVVSVRTTPRKSTELEYIGDLDSFYAIKSGHSSYPAHFSYSPTDATHHFCTPHHAHVVW